MEGRTWEWVGGCAIVAFTITGIQVAQSGDFERVGVLLLLVALGAVSWPILKKTAAASNDPKLFHFLLLAMLLKLLSSYIRYYVAYDVFGGVTDSQGYHHAGWELAQRFANLNFNLDGTELQNFGRETRNIAVVVGALYTVIGANRMGGFLFFSWLSFCGLIAFQRAFQVAFPKGRHAIHARVLFLLPSLLFWPSGIGKEGYMLFALGITMLGVARLYSGQAPLHGLGLALVGGWLLVQVRPHVALIVVVGAVAAVLARPPKANAPTRTRVLRNVLLVALIPVGFNVSAHVHTYFGQEGAGSLSDALETAKERSSRGGSSYETVPANSPVEVPMAWMTVMYRPFPNEAGGSVPMMLASMEGVVLLLGSGVFLLRPDRLLRIPLRNPYSMACLAYSIAFVVAFSNIGNFGILTRQRTQVFPLLLAYLVGMIPPKVRPGEAADIEQWAVKTGYEEPAVPAHPSFPVPVPAP